MYAVANALAMPDFANPFRLEESKGGNTMGQLCRWLHLDGHDVAIDTIWFDTYGTKLPEAYCKFNVSECKAAPFLFNVRLSENGKNHLIAAHLMSTGDLVVCDSLRSEPFTTTLPEINDHYHTVYGFYCFVNLKGDHLFFH